jgi:hypothetical protein
MDLIKFIVTSPFINAGQFLHLSSIHNYATGTEKSPDSETCPAIFSTL